MFNSECCAAVEQSRHRQVLLRQTMSAHHDHGEQTCHQAGAPLPVSNIRLISQPLIRTTKGTKGDHREYEEQEEPRANLGSSM
jgi:hypothetical protein